MTFDDALAEIAFVITNTLFNGETIINVSSSAEPAKSSKVRMTRSMKVRDMTWVRLTGKSPIRKVNGFYTNEAARPEDRPIIERRKWCPGNAVYCVSFDEKEKMIVKKGRRISKFMRSLFKVNKCLVHHLPCLAMWSPYEGIDAVVRLSAPKKVYCLNTCWISWHQEGLDRIHKESVDVVTDED